MKTVFGFLPGRFFRLTGRFLRNIVPENRYGDHFFSFLKFISRHKRLPTRKMLFNDVFYRIKTSNEILDPLRVFVSDKEFLKLYVKAVVGDQYNVPTIDIINDNKTIDNYHFPDECCIKPTHASKSIIIRTDSLPIDKAAIKDWLIINYYRVLREANYKMLKPKIIIEPLVFDKTNIEDYKFFCYKGRPKLIQIDIDRFADHKRKFFDTNWTELYFSITYPRFEGAFLRPDNLEEMLKIAASLSKPFSLIRIDLYSNGKDIRVGEITNISGSAGESFLPASGESEASCLLFDERE